MKRNETQYVQDDTMFIKVQVDFLSKSLGKNSYWKENSLFLSI
jgi:hypothetical protein